MEASTVVDNKMSRTVVTNCCLYHSFLVFSCLSGLVVYIVHFLCFRVLVA
jgi:hypothetical protein